MGLDKSPMAGTHHDSILEGSFTAPEILCAPALAPTPGNPWAFTVSVVLLLQYVLELESYSL